MTNRVKQLTNYGKGNLFSKYNRVKDKNTKDFNCNDPTHLRILSTPKSLVTI